MNIRKTMKNKWVSLSIGIMFLVGGGKFFFSLNNSSEKEIARINGLPVSSEMYFSAYKKEKDFRERFKQMGINLDYPIDSTRIIEECLQRIVAGSIVDGLGLSVGPRLLWKSLEEKLPREVLAELKNQGDGSLNLEAYAKFSRLYQGQSVERFEKEQVENIKKEVLGNFLKKLWHTPSYVKKFKENLTSSQKKISQIIIEEKEIEKRALEQIEEKEINALYESSSSDYLGGSSTSVEVEVIDFSQLKPEEVRVSEDEVKRFYNSNLKKKYHIPAKYKINFIKISQGVDSSGGLKALLNKIEVDLSITGKYVVDQVSFLTKNREVSSNTEINIEIELGQGKMPDALESKIRKIASDKQAKKTVVHKDGEVLYLVTLLNKSDSKVIDLKEAKAEIETELSKKKLTGFIEKVGDIVVRAARSEGNVSERLINNIVLGVLDLKSNDSLENVLLSKESLQLKNIDSKGDGSAKTSIEKAIFDNLKPKQIRLGMISKVIDNKKLIVFKVSKHDKPKKKPFESVKNIVKNDLINIKKKDVISDLKKEIKNELPEIMDDLQKVKQYAAGKGYKVTLNNNNLESSLEHCGQVQFTSGEEGLTASWISNIITDKKPLDSPTKEAQEQIKAQEYIQDDYFVEFVLAGVVKNAKIELSNEFFPENSKN